MSEIYWQSATCKMIDVIAQSIAMHPSALVESLERVRDIHAAFRNTTADKKAADCARSMCEAVGRALEYVRDGRADPFADDFSAKVQTFQQAANLQLIPLHILKAIVDRE